MSRKNNVTYVDDLIDLNDIPSPSRQIEQENNDRYTYSNPIKSKLRNNVDFRRAVNGGGYQEQYQPQYVVEEPYIQKNVEPVYIQQQMNCIDIAKHISGCPICSRIYNDDYKTPYIIIIIILVIISIILLKKIINKN